MRSLIPLTDPYQENQFLGQSLGRMQIECTLKAETSRWTKPSEDSAEITGLLYFDIAYNDHGNSLLRTASVQIDVGKEVNSDPVPTFRACAPLAGVKGPPVRQHVVDNRTTDPQAELTSSFGGVKGSGLKHDVSKETDNEHRWYFKASHGSDKLDPRVTRTRFTWSRTLLEDCTGLNRLYEGALILHRTKDKPLTLRVAVEAQAWKWYHRILQPRSKSRDSLSIHRFGSFLELADFRKQEQNIQKLIVDRNFDLAAAEVPNVRVVVSPLEQAEPSVTEQSSAQEDSITHTTDNSDITNALLNASVSVAEQVMTA